MAADAGRGPGDRRPTTSRSVRRRRTLAVLLTVVLVVGVSLGVAYWRLQDNVTRIDVSSALATDRPTHSDGPLNLLLIGSDTRVGQDTPDAASVQGARSDTTLIAHFSADRRHVTVVSVPRDSMVKMPPNCDAKIPKDQWTVQQINSAFSQGGPACLINTLEADTGLYMNHFAVVDFNGFKGMVDALGGVPVCTATPIDDPKAHLKLGAGRHTLSGAQALGYVRARYDEGDGSDLGRIKRQQAFLSSVVQEATRTSLLLRPDRLYAFLDAATKSLTTDKGLGVGEMRDIAESVQHTGMQNIAFVTVPTETYPQDPNRVQWTPEAKTLWTTLKRDEPVAKPSASPTPTSTGAPLTVSPKKIDVVVVNATGTDGLAGDMASALQVQGFTVTTDSVTQRPDGVDVRYGPGQKEAARTVQAAFPGSRLTADSTLGSQIRVVVGAGAKPVVAVPNRVGTTPLPTPTVTAPAPSATIEARTANQSICS